VVTTDNLAGDSLSDRSNKDKTIQDWLYAAASDLKCAKVLYDSRLFSAALYHLQQSSEKLAKGLLIAMGFLSHKRAKKDLRIKEMLGFLPKEPAAYRHRTMPSFLSDVEKTIPSIDDFLNLIESSELGPRIQEYHLLVRKGKKGVKKLKKKPFRPVENADQLKGEVRAAEVILGALDDSVRKMTQEMAKLDLYEAYQVAKGLVKAQGFSVEGVEPPNFDQIKERVVHIFKLSVLIAMSVALTSLLDPLEAITRYPDSHSSSFDEANPYVANFGNLCKAVACILEKSQDLALD
jgi:hypothetical protein